MKQLTLIGCLMLCLLDTYGQGVAENRTGKVSYVSSQHIYVRFLSTAGLSAGDTLYISSGDALYPAFVVVNLSSTSCICTKLTDVTPVITDPVVAKIRSKPVEKPLGNDALVPAPLVTDTASALRQTGNERKQPVTGGFSVSTYADYSNSPADNSLRFKYNLSLQAPHIANSKFSVESYISFRHKQGDWSEVTSDLFRALKIYNLSVRYEPDKATRFLLGRSINPKISSIGAMDGLQVEKTIKKFTLGALAGTRPDYVNYGFNGNLFQYGAYLAYSSKKDKAYSESSFAFMEQLNQWKTDRRFIYFQHTNSLISNLNVFFSFEADLYQVAYDSLNNEIQQHRFSFTGLYFSLRYKLTDKLSVSGSYDARKNVMYYETYKTAIDTLLEKEMRQGFRLKANYRITKNIAFGIQSGYRYLKSDPHASKNINGYLTYNQFGGLKLSATLSATYLENSYMTGKIAGLNLSRDFKGKLHTGIGYRYIDYRLPESLEDLTQHLAEVNLNWQFYRNLSLSAYYEATFEQSNRYHRLYAQLRIRF
jgi:hypothetical protein